MVFHCSVPSNHFGQEYFASTHDRTLECSVDQVEENTVRIRTTTHQFKHEDSQDALRQCATRYSNVSERP